jgi:hypothetical protein
MASEITVTARLSASKSSTSVANSSTSYVHDMTGDQMFHSNPSITTTAALLSLGTVDTSARYHLFLRNQDATNEVWLSFDGGSTWPLIILPGKSIGPIVVAASQTLWLDAQVAACIVEVVAVEI